MSKLLFNLQELAQGKYQNGFFDHFNWFISPHLWTSILTDSGTASVGDAKGGILALVASDGSVADNDQTLIKSTNETFLFASGEPICFEAKIQYSEANVDDANIGVGLSNAVAADLMVDDGGGMKTSGDILAIYKTDGSTVWKCFSSKGSSQTSTTSVGNGVTATAGGASYQILRIEFRPITSTFAEVHFFLDGLALLDSNQKAIVHRFDYSSSPTEMQAFASVKNGFTNLETLNIDYIGCYQGSL